MAKVKRWQDLLTKTQRVTKKKVVCHDGPWVGHTLCVSTLPTAWMNIRGEEGRYNFHGQWEKKDANSTETDCAPGTTGDR